MPIREVEAKISEQVNGGVPQKEIRVTLLQQARQPDYWNTLAPERAGDVYRWCRPKLISALCQNGVR